MTWVRVTVMAWAWASMIGVPGLLGGVVGYAGARLGWHRIPALILSAAVAVVASLLLGMVPLVWL